MWRRHFAPIKSSVCAALLHACQLSTMTEMLASSRRRNTDICLHHWSHFGTVICPSNNAVLHPSTRPGTPIVLLQRYFSKDYNPIKHHQTITDQSALLSSIIIDFAIGAFILLLATSYFFSFFLADHKRVGSAKNGDQRPHFKERGKWLYFGGPRSQRLGQKTQFQVRGKSHQFGGT